jgi:PAS domain S-box-containing protein
MWRVQEVQENLSRVSDPMSLIPSMFALAPVGFQIFDSSGTSVLVNEAFRKMFSTTSSDETNIFQDHAIKEIAEYQRTGVSKQAVKQSVRYFNASESKLQMQPSDDCHVIELTTYPILDQNNSVKNVCFIYRDITSEIQLSAQVKESRIFLETAASFNKIGTWISGVHPDDPVTWSKPVLEIMGLEEGPYQLKTFFDAIHTLDRETVTKRIDQSARTGAPYSLEHRIVRPNGEIRWIRSSGEFNKKENGKVLAMGICQDITEAKRAEELQQITQARYQKLFDSEVMGIFLADTRGGVFDANDAYLKIIGYSREDLLAGKISWANMTPPEYAHLDLEGVKSLVATGNCPPYRKKYIRKDGTTVPVVVGGALVQMPGTEVISFAFDLSEMTRLELQFMQSQKMESMGRFAGGIAHDFNNILALIMLMVDQAIATTPDENTSTNLSVIQGAAERGARLTRQILAFSRKQVIEPRNLDLNVVLKDMEAMLRRMIHENITFQVDVSSEPLMIFCDQGQVEQCIMNLIVNACDAMPKGGDINVSLKMTKIDSSIKIPSLSQIKQGDYVTLSITDSGSGMSEETISQIFEPFFTTKEKGKGTGLGLSTVFGIVRQMKGDIAVESRLGEGSCFTIYLPRSMNAELAQPIAPLIEKAQSGDNRKILLVEDESLLREATAKILRNSGFVVVEARDGQDAWELFQASPESFDLIVTDVITPRMTGASLVQKISETAKRSIPVVYLSGYTADELEIHGIRRDTSFFVEKPFSSTSFLSTIMRAGRIE